MASSSGIPKVQLVAEKVRGDAEFFWCTSLPPGETAPQLPPVVPFEQYTPIGAMTQTASGTNWFVKVKVRVRDAKEDEFLQLRVHEDFHGRVKLTGMLMGRDAAGAAHAFEEGFFKALHEDVARPAGASAGAAEPARVVPIDHGVKVAFERCASIQPGGAQALSVREIGRVLKELGVAPNSTTCAALLKRYDADGNRTLNLAEFNAMYKELRALLGVRKSDTQHYASGQMYSGDFLDGLFHGKGSFTFLDGSMYKGEWQNGLKHGEGMLRTSVGEVYQGEWHCGSPKKLTKMSDPPAMF